MQDSRQVYVDKILSNVFLGFPETGFVAEQVLPTLNVQDLTGLAFKLDESHMVNPGSSLRSGYARAKRIGMNLTQTSYGPLLEHSLEIAVTDQVMQTYDTPLKPESHATNAVSKQLLIEKEIVVRDFLTTLGNYNTANRITLSGTAKWSDGTSPLEDQINTAREAVYLGCGNYPNQVVLTKPVLDSLRKHPTVQSRLAGAVRITNEERDSIIRDLFQVDKIVRADALISDQVEDALSGNKTRIWGNDAVFQYVTPAPALETLTQGYLLRLDPKTNQGNGSPLVGVDKWYEKPIKSTIIRANDFYVPWLVANSAAYLFKAAI